MLYQDHHKREDEGFSDMDAFRIGIILLKLFNYDFSFFFSYLKHQAFIFEFKKHQAFIFKFQRHKSLFNDIWQFFTTALHSALETLTAF